jgi:hypothetical protein
MHENVDPSGDIHFHDLAPAIEFACWVVVVLCPLLRLINGAAVTNDQLVIQIALFSIALTAAIALRLYHLLHKSDT